LLAKLPLLKRLRPYWLLFIHLLLSLGKLFLHIVRQVILPTRRRKGNLLSSLFVFFTSVVEQLIGFGEAVSHMLAGSRRPFAGQEVLRRTWTYSQKYLRLVVLVATWILFVLSFFEGMGSRLMLREHVVARQEASVKEQDPWKNHRDQPFVAEWASPGYTKLLSYTIFSFRRREPADGYPYDRWRMLCVLRI